MSAPLSLDRLRQVLQTLHASGIGRISHQAVYECFEEATEPAFQARVRRQMDELVGRKELERVAPGVFIYPGPARRSRSRPSATCASSSRRASRKA